jgi:ribonucleoside-diphosphate reductase alpha chain
MYFHALWASTELAEQFGPHPRYNETRAAQGDLQFDLAGATPTDAARWQTLRDRIAAHGLRNSLMIAIAPTATIASIAGCYECIEPQVSNLWKRETLSGDFLQVNRFLVEDLKALGLWTDSTRAALKQANGSVQQLPGLPDQLKSLYRTVWELPMRGLLDMAAERGPFIDQSQSLNLFVESPSIGALSSMYFYAWKKGLKTTYYLRSRPATEIAKTVAVANTSAGRGAEGGTPPPDPKPASPDNAAAAEIACSLENPESCEACQ